MADRKERYERKQSAKERRQQQSRNARRGNLRPFRSPLTIIMNKAAFDSRPAQLLYFPYK